jgi:antirestriction protein
MRAYIADLAAYNEGHLVGEWIELDSQDHVEATIAELLATWKREECAVHDWDGPKALSSFGEYPNWSDVFSFVDGFEKHGEAFALWWDNDSTNRGVDAFEECYQGVYSDLAEYAGRCLDDGLLGDVPKGSLLVRYFDYEAYERDLDLGGDIWTGRGSEGPHVFSNH